ncbi:MAG: hypothetical protein ACP5RT_01345 [Candidatus Micrarchaeia archaeon]
MSKKDAKKRFELFKKTLNVDSIVEKGSIEDKALYESAGDDRPVEEEHALNLITKNEELPTEKSEISKKLPKSKQKKVSANQYKKKTKK